jgi:hypothetical protein
MNKKAVMHIPTETLMGIAVLVIVILLVFLPLFSNIYNYFFGSKVTKLSENNFGRLSATVKYVVDSKSDNFSTSDIFSFDNPAVVIGFNSKCSYLDNDPECPKSSCSDSNYDKFISKPKKCAQDSGCICLFAELKVDEPPVKCTSFGNNVIFVSDKDFTSSFASDSVPGFKNLVVYGECGSFKFNPQEIFIKKSVVNGVNYIFFTTNSAASFS